MSDKNKTHSLTIALQIGVKIVNNPKEVCDAFKEYFVNVATNIGSSDVLNENDDIQEIIENHKNHPSITKIKSMYQCDVEFLSRSCRK